MTCLKGAGKTERVSRLPWHLNKLDKPPPKSSRNLMKKNMSSHSIHKCIFTTCICANQCAKSSPSRTVLITKGCISIQTQSQDEGSFCRSLFSLLHDQSLQNHDFPLNVLVIQIKAVINTSKILVTDC